MKPLKTLILLVVVSATAFSLSACSSAKEKMGLVEKTPDEFMVVRRAPLEMPPNFNLRPPMPGADRPQEINTLEQARSTVFGQDNQAVSTTAQPSDATTAFLNEAGASMARDDIRTLVDKEVLEGDRSKQPVFKRLTKIGTDEMPSTIVDAKKERQRIEQNIANDAPITEGETPYTDG